MGILGLHGGPRATGNGVLRVFAPVGLNGVFECTFKSEMYSTRA